MHGGQRLRDCQSQVSLPRIFRTRKSTTLRISRYASYAILNCSARCGSCGTWQPLACGTNVMKGLYYLMQMAEGLDKCLKTKTRTHPMKLTISVKNLEREGDSWALRRRPQITMADQCFICMQGGWVMNEIFNPTTYDS
jgi:hypothetical protein